MDTITGLIGFFDHIIDALELLFFGTIAAIVGVSVLPKDNPLHALLVSFTKHLAATFAIAVVALPVQPIPGLDVAYDTGSMLFLLYYWGTFAFDLLKDSSPLHSHVSPADAPDAPRQPSATKPRRTWGSSLPTRRAPAPVIDAEASDAQFYDTERLH